jgi:hypothetical protein
LASPPEYCRHFFFAYLDSYIHLELDLEVLNHYNFGVVTCAFVVVVVVVVEVVHSSNVSVDDTEMVEDLMVVLESWKTPLAEALEVVLRHNVVVVVVLVQLLAQFPH